MTSLDQSPSDNPPGRPSAADRDAADAEATTAAWLLAGLASRLRAAYEEGADVGALAAACRQPESEVVRLLGLAGARTAGQPRGLPRTGPTAVPAAPAAPLPGGPDFRRTRRPAPSRRLSRLHPRSEPAPQAGPASAPVPLPRSDGPAPAAENAPPSTEPPIAVQPQPRRAPEATPAPQAPPAPQESREPAAPDAPQTPMGILIGASPTYAEPPSTQGSSGPRRVPAELVRLGRGTSLAVLPSWRTAIAVSVPTELLLAATGLAFQELPGVRLTVLINPDALHDRELDLHGWRAERGAAGTGD
ncbi:hypothetical protein ACFC1R_07780 [Kitasatospora sp. NPDC056138]|uniref:hypothetical protein n=1 Tax=Kitasatospora sp. NPDC056138 TaxID=3345724 RepID=UPI0035E06269